jgi:hypothetical protein
MMTRHILKHSIAPTLVYMSPLNSSFEDWLDFTTLTNKRVKVRFICPVTLSVHQDATTGEVKGYEMDLPRDWVEDYGPALLISLKLLKIASAAGL